MTAPVLSRLLIDDAPCQFRAVACDADGRAWQLFQERWRGVEVSARYGEVFAANITRFADQERAAFCRLAGGEEAFLRLTERMRYTEGQGLHVRVVAEARRDKLARVIVHDGPEQQARSAFSRWRAALPLAEGTAPETDRALIDAVFHDILVPHAPLPGGGRIHIEPTRALAAIDVDAAGRSGRGSAGARALSLGREAAAEAARQVLLRGLGGLIVIDLPGPLNKAARHSVRTLFAETVRAVTDQDVKVLPASPLGLMEASLAWRYQPMSELLLDASGEPTAETVLLDGLRRASREASACPGDFLELLLPEPVWEMYVSRKKMCDDALMKHGGGRISVLQGRKETLEVRRR